MRVRVRAQVIQQAQCGLPHKEVKGVVGEIHEIERNWLKWAWPSVSFWGEQYAVRNVTLTGCFKTHQAVAAYQSQVCEMQQICKNGREMCEKREWTFKSLLLYSTACQQ